MAKEKTLLMTLAIGQSYSDRWRRMCEANWREYAARHGYDVLVVENPLDESPRGKSRNPAWQKCLILSQAFSKKYDRIIWLDTDILINNSLAPSIADGVPIEKVGAVPAYATPTRDLFSQALRRTYEHWESMGVRVQKELTPKNYYEKFGMQLSDDCDVVQSGVLLLSPKYHRDLLEKVYNEYEPRIGPEWDGSDAWSEMRPLSYELIKANLVHWIDHRFNQGWLPYQVMHYPFLGTPKRRPGLMGRIERRLAKTLGRQNQMDDLRHTCATAAYVNSYFLHFAGSVGDMDLVNPNVKRWQDVKLGMCSKS